MKLLGIADYNCGTYSGDIRRKLGIAIAFVGNPKIVYLDEPTNGMDSFSKHNCIIGFLRSRLLGNVFGIG